MSLTDTGVQRRLPSDASAAALTHVPPSDELELRPVVFHRDPFAPGHNETVWVSKSATLADIADAIEGTGWLSPHERPFLAAELGGELIPSENWRLVRPKEGAPLRLGVRPQGDGEKILRTVLMIAVIAVAAWISRGALVPLLGQGFAAGTFGAAFAAAAFSTVAMLAVNALIPPRGLDSDGGALTDSKPLYSITGAQNAFAPLEPLDVLLGEHRVFPRKGATGYVEALGEEIYYTLLVLWGPIDLEIEDERVGDTPLEQLDGWTSEHRLHSGDPWPTLYRGDIDQEQVGATLESTVDFEGRRTQDGAVRVGFIVSAPRGLGVYDSKGRAASLSVELMWRYRSVQGEPGSEIYGDWVYPWGFGRTFSRTAPGKPFFINGSSEVPEGRYDVEVRRVSAPSSDETAQDELKLEIIESQTADQPVLRDDVAFSVYRFKGTDETSGQIQTLNAIGKRRAATFPNAVLDQGDLSGVSADDLGPVAATRNPAELVLWLRRYSGAKAPLEPYEINWPAFAAWAKTCRDEGWTFDGVVNGGDDVDEATDTIAAAGNARCYWNGAGELTPVMDVPRPTLIQTFSERNARNIRAEKAFPEEVHAYRVLFNDRRNLYKETETFVYVEGHTKETATKIEMMRVPGKTDWNDIHEFIHRLYKTSRYQTRKLFLDVEAINLEAALGDPVGVQTRVLARGRESGFVRSVGLGAGGLIETIELDAPVTMESGEDFGIKWSGARDDGSGRGYYLVSDPAPLDYAAGPTRTVTLASPVDPAEGPRPGDLWHFGLLGDEILECLIRNWDPIDDEWVRLECCNYAPERFEGLPVVPEYEAIVDTPSHRTPPAPELVTAYGDPSGLYALFRMPPHYRGEVRQFRAWWRLALETGGSAEPAPWEPLAPLAPSQRLVAAPPGLIGQGYQIRIQAIDADGDRGPFLITDPILAGSGVVPEPVIVSVDGVTRASASGVKRPAIAIESEPEEDPRIEWLIVAIREVAKDGAGGRLPEGDQPAWRTAIMIDPAEGKGDVSGVTADEDYDVALYFRMFNQDYSESVVYYNIHTPAEVTASGFTPGGGIAAALETKQLAIEALQLADADFGDELASIDGLLTVARSDIGRISYSEVPPGPSVGAGSDIILIPNKSATGGGFAGKIQIDHADSSVSEGFIDHPSLGRVTQVLGAIATYFEGGNTPSYIPPGQRVFVMYKPGGFTASGAVGKLGVTIWDADGGWRELGLGGGEVAFTPTRDDIVMAVCVVTRGNGLIDHLRATYNALGPVNARLDIFEADLDDAKASIVSLQQVQGGLVSNTDQLLLRMGDVELTNTNQGQLITDLEAGKAEASALEALQVEVGDAGDSADANGSVYARIASQGLIIVDLEDGQDTLVAQYDALSLQANDNTLAINTLSKIQDDQALQITSLTAKTNIGGNLVANADLSRGDAIWNTSSSNPWTYFNHPTIGRYYEAQIVGANSVLIIGDYFRVSPGQALSASVEAMRGAVSTWAFIRFQFYDSSGGYLGASGSTSFTSIPTNAKAWTSLENQIVPANAHTALLTAYMNSTTGYLRVFKAKAERGPNATAFSTEEDDLHRESELSFLLQAEPDKVEAILVGQTASGQSVFSLTQGPDGGAITAASDVVALLNTVDGGVIEALRASGGDIQVMNRLFIGENREITFDPVTLTRQIRAGSMLNVEGGPFGVGSDLFEWQGINRSDISTCSKENALYARLITGEVWRDGAPEVSGTITTGGDGSAFVNNGLTVTCSENHLTGGADITVDASVAYLKTITGAGVQGLPSSWSGSFTLQLQRNLNNGGWVNLGSAVTANGSFQASYDAQNEQFSKASESASGDVSATYNVNNGDSVQFRVVVTASGWRLGGKYNVSIGSAEQ